MTRVHVTLVDNNTGTVLLNTVSKEVNNPRALARALQALFEGWFERPCKLYERELETLESSIIKLSK